MELGLIIALVIVGGALLIAEIFAVVVRIMLFVRYQQANNVPNSQNYTARQAARLFLDANDLPEVKVEKCGWIRASIYGNSYSSRKKTIYLRRGIIDKASITAVALALQKCAIAIQYKEGDKGTKIRTWTQPLLPFAPFFFVPIIFVGFLFDVIVMKTETFAGTITASIIAGSIFLFSIFASLLIAKVENRANKRAIQIMEESNFLGQAELVEVKKIFKMYIYGYVADFIISILSFLMVILKAVLKVVKKDK